MQHRGREVGGKQEHCTCTAEVLLEMVPVSTSSTPTGYLCGLILSLVAHTPKIMCDYTTPTTSLHIINVCVLHKQ